ncbi:MAG: cytochrome c1 [Janthinobacterium lividum]
MRKMFPVFALICTMLFAGAAFAQESVPLDKAPDRTDDLVAMQRGARLFVNYCLNCHSANVVRYSRLGDLGLSPTVIEKNLLFTTDKVGDTMTIAMRPADSKAWLGITPPDLSLEERARGPDWLYTYLRSFYRDGTRPTGWNNLVFENVGMPHVLWQLQGQRSARFETEKGEDGGAPIRKFTGYQQITPGTMSTPDYDSAMADLVSYMGWMAEPARHTRKQIGVWVLLFLGVFVIVTWRLNAAFWRDIKA